MERFEIEGLQPIGGDFWKVQVSIRTFEDLGERNVAQAANLTVRVRYDHGGDVKGLLQLAVDEAKRCLGLSSAYLQEHSLADLLSEIEL